jgi:hypothetical protein
MAALEPGTEYGYQDGGVPGPESLTQYGGESRFAVSVRVLQYSSYKERMVGRRSKNRDWVISNLARAWCAHLIVAPTDHSRLIPCRRMIFNRLA